MPNVVWKHHSKDYVSITCTHTNEMSVMQSPWITFILKHGTATDLYLKQFLERKVFEPHSQKAFTRIYA